MADNFLNLTIEKLAGLGDGLAAHNGQRIFVPYTAPGDMVRARLMRKVGDVLFASIDAIVTPGPDRTQPVCKHFSVCGGCALQHVNDAIYADFKQTMAREAVRKAGFDAGVVVPLVRLPAASRRRVELKVEYGKLGYYEERSHRLVDIEECKVLEPALEALLMRLKPVLTGMPGLNGIHINGVDDGYDVTLLGDTGIASFPEDESVRRVSAFAKGKLQLLRQYGSVTMTMGQVKVEVPPRAFLQASSEAQAIMVQEVLAGIGQAEKVLDLFAGLGTYSFPLSLQAEVEAVEGDAPMVHAMQVAIGKYALKKVKASQRDLFQNPLSTGALKRFDAVVINPPRNGAKEQSAALAEAKVKKLVMVSCNPATFTRDAARLREGGYQLLKVTPFDQFVYSPHLEIIAEFAS